MTEPTQPTGGPPRAIWIVTPIAIVMLFFVILLATRDSGDKGFSFDLEGQVAPSIIGTTLDGDEFDLDDYRGGFVVVNFFQTTCIPCIQEHPELVAFQQTYGPSGFATIVSIAFDDRPENIRTFFDEFGGDWPILAADTGPMAVDYGVSLVPESVVVAPDGEVLTKLLGGVKLSTLEEIMQSWQEANA